MRVLCTICARGGSKRVPGKNVRMIAGRPLIAHTVEQARAAGVFRMIAVSSDDERILSAAREAGADLAVNRPEALASDVAAKAPAIRHCAEEAERHSGERHDVFVDLDTTSPLRLPSDILGAISLLRETGCGNVITGAPAHRSPYFNLVERDKAGIVRLSKPLAEPIARSQDSPECFDMNASIYVWSRASFFSGPRVFGEDTRLFEMPRERSLDIDSELDFELVSYLMERTQERPR